MANTPFGIYYPTSGTDLTPLQSPFATMAASIDTAVFQNKVQIHQVANISARSVLAASYSPSPTKPLLVWRIDAPGGENLEYTVNGTNWYPYRSAVSARVPTSSATGEIAVGALAQNATANVTINFPAGRFTSPPIVVATSNNARLTVATQTPTTTTVNCVIGNWSNAASAVSAVRWTATQMI